jgi:hypothetical protein
MRARIGAMAVAVAAATLSTAARGQECFEDFWGGNLDWPVSSMVVNVNYTSIGGAWGGERTCALSDTRRRAAFKLWGYGVWNQDGSWSGTWLGYISWWRQYDGVRFDLYLAQSGAATSGTVSIACVPTAPMSLSVYHEEIAGGWVIEGGEVITPPGASSATRFFRAGEAVVMEMAFSVPGHLGTDRALTWSPCADSNLNGICDMYETVARDFGDFDASGDVGAPDLATMLSAWGSSGETNGAIDLDDDGVVGASDLGILLSRWGLGA